MSPALSRRALFAGASAAAGACAALATSARAADELGSRHNARALLWAARRDRYFDMADSSAERGWDEANERRCSRLHDVAWSYQERLLAMPCASPTIARVQLESVARWSESGLYPAGPSAVRKVIAYLEAL